MEKKTTTDLIEMARQMVDIIADKKGEDIVLMDLRGRTIVADFFILCSGNSDRQIKAIAEDLRSKIKEDYGIIPRSIEGDARSGWLLIDYGDIVVHAFAPEVRRFYALEDFWMEHEASILLKMQ